MKVAAKIRILTSVLALASSVAVGLVMYGGYRETIATLEVDVLKQRVDGDVFRLKSAFQEVSHDIRLLVGLPEVRGLANGSKRSVADLEDDLAQTFEQLLLAKPHYVQVRLIGVADEGRERVRVDRTESGALRRTGSELQTKGHRDYFKATQAKASGQIFYSNVNLNRENNRIEVPYQPMLRVAMPVYGATDTCWGIVIINLDFNGFTKEFLGESAQSFRHFLCNAEGDYLLHPEEEKMFGFDLGKRIRIQDEYPGFEGFLDSSEAERTLALKEAGGDLGSWFHLRKVAPLEDGRVFLYGVSARFDEVISATGSIARRTFLIMLVLLVLALVGAFSVSLLITKPIERITLASRRLGEGKEDVDLPVGRRDEIGTLASSFEEMRGAIREQEERILDTNQKLSSANVDLKHFAHIASHELREPLTRIAGLSSLMERKLEGVNGDDLGGLAKSVKLEASSALQQITDFRVFSHLGDGTSVRESVDLRALVLEVLKEFAPKMEALDVLVAVDQMPQAEVYRNLVRVLYRNLVENALKYAEGSGFTLRLTCEQDDSGPVFGVFNSRSSIPEEKRTRIFQVFTRFHPELDGTGMGLSICKRVVECHMGKIWVESGSDWTHFKFTLRG
ncbi:sensor histidine kinase [Pelagicoccus sp. SDUM812005]|uniref:sensor histidine kinase n=1 Tax=Pelagicoccus sp. SDUM812005 TaxID=3041257 RepID=UPI00280FDE82|nr:sensor histidine kinase [Pelagicoccus sp. SDUM812005]MDQ8181230.1 sensor histidine kinase [Pelagicoccus sp. SDUM812005]